MEQTAQAEAPIKDRWLTVTEAASFVGLSEKGLRNRIQRGDGPKIARLGARTIRIHSADLRAWIQKAGD